MYIHVDHNTHNSMNHNPFTYCTTYIIIVHAKDQTNHHSTQRTWSTQNYIALDSWSEAVGLHRIT